MNDAALIRLGGFTLTRFGALTMLGFLLMLATARLLAGRRARLSRAVPLFGVWALPLGLIGSRLLFVAVNAYEFFPDAPLRALMPWTGGHSLCGALAGGAAAAFIAARQARCKPARLLDALAPGAMLLVLCVRIAEGAIGEGVGKEITTEFLMNTPFAMEDIYGAPRHAAYRLEAATAAVIFAVALVSRARKPRSGETARRVLLLYAATQVVWESLRDDGCLRVLGYVRVSQVICFLALISLLVYYAARYARARRVDIMFVLWLVAAAMGAILTVRQEFAVDNEGNLEFSYLLMALGVGAVAGTALYISAKSHGKARRKRQ